MISVIGPIPKWVELAFALLLTLMASVLQALRHLPVRIAMTLARPVPMIDRYCAAGYVKLHVSLLNLMMQPRTASVTNGDAPPIARRRKRPRQAETAWVYEELSDHRSIASLVDAYHSIVYPMSVS